jgi:hypothetical protein
MLAVYLGDPRVLMCLESIGVRGSPTSAATIPET